MLHGHQLHKFNDQMIEKSGEEGAGNLELHKNDEPILHMHVSEDDAQDLFVIENPWKNAVEQFPGVAQIRSKFGMWWKLIDKYPNQIQVKKNMDYILKYTICYIII